MIIYEVRKDSFEFSAKGINNSGDIENAFVCSDFDGETILKTGDETAAISKISKCKSTAYRVSGVAGSLICGDVYYIEIYEANDDGEFISGADFIFAKWSTNIFE